MLSIPVYYDFASTLCYVAHRVMERIAADLTRLEITLEWRPVDLTGITGWRRGAPVEGRRRENALRVSQELSVAVRMPTRWLDSRAAGAVALSLRGSVREYTWRERVWSAIHEEGRDLESPDELERLGTDLGLDVASLLSGDCSEHLQTQTAEARRAGVTGVPTFMLDEWAMGGIQEDETMRILLEKFARKKRREAEA